MVQSRVVGDVNKNAPYELVLGDGHYYEHKETGVEIRLFQYSGSKSGDPELITVSGGDKHGNQYNLTAKDLYKHYEQKQQSDFTDPVDPRLPYVFDLFYDVKTVSGLKRHIQEEGIDRELAAKVKEHGIVLELSQEDQAMLKKFESNSVIDEAYIQLEGDMSVGIPNQSCIISEIGFDLDTLLEEDRKESVEEFREKLADAFEVSWGERPSVSFDIERDIS